MSRNLLIRFATMVVLGSLLAGCSSSGPQVVSVSGTLTRDGKPVPNMEIYFLPTQGRNSVGSSDEQGRFNLGYTVETEGAQVGTHTVFVIFNPPAESGAAPPSNLGEILAKYGSKEVSPLKIEITKPIDNLEIKLD